MRIKIGIPLTLTLSHKGAREKFKKVITGVADHGSHFTFHGIFRIDISSIK